MTTNDRHTDEPKRLSRRRILAGSAGAFALTLAGCLGDGGDGDESDGADGNESDGGDGDANDGGDDNGGDGTPSAPDVTESGNVPQTPQVSDPPEAVYLPTHREAMVHLDPVETGPYTVAPMLSYPHRFWLVTGSEVEEVRPEGQGVHLMFSVRDSETGAVLPVGVGAEIRLFRDGDVIDTRSPWPMLSQTMGFHFGDNVSLPDQGRYTVEVSLNPIGVRRTGEFAGRFETRRTATVEFEFDQEFQRQVVEGVEFLDEEEWGEPGALEPMGGMGHGEGAQENGSEMDGHGGDGDTAGQENDGIDGHEMRYSALPPAEEYPGRALGEPTSGDAAFVVRYLSETHLSDGGYLLVSPRTPYNRVPLADMALSVSGAIEGELVQTLDSEVGHHYGLDGSLSPGDTVELAVDSPPQVARHQGYDTAFLDMPSMTVEETE